MSSFRVDRNRRVALRLSLLGLLGISSLSLAPLFKAARAEEEMKVVPAPVVDDRRQDATSETAVLAGGCFWGVQAVFQHVNGVSRAVSGYAGGAKDTAHYEVVGSGRTGHAESVEVTFDPRIISYGQILQIFFSVAHNPTELNRQGPDVGTQYRSAIFTTDAPQRRIAEAYIAQLNAAGIYRKPIATTVNDPTPFYAAEAYHQNYATLHPNDLYIAYNDRPKVEGLKRLFPATARKEPVLLKVVGSN